ncbi:hypothetical protein [Evansella cellulosilytica]|uniref:hypothetical protein n=1 Tax=Evansella cellulosilytica TaxID=1413 RepID=UPI0002FA9DD2|nr:hypothetical protein [Evansella cellulosilytica]
MKTFINGHTSEGFFSLLNQFWSDYKIYVVSGATSKSRSKLLSEVASELRHKTNVEILLHPNDGETVDGIVLKDKKALLISDNGPLYPSSRYYGLIDHVINLNDCFTTNNHYSLAEVKKLMNEVDGHRFQAYKSFAKGREIHEKKESIYLSAMNFKAADEAADEIMNEWITRISVPEENPIVTQRFFGAATAFGPINYINDITADVNNRIIIKGRSGSGKSTLMRKIGDAAEKKDVTVHYYPCALDPNSLDMIIIPALSFAIVDGTAPHIINAERDGDRILDMFTRCIDPIIEEDNDELLDQITYDYKKTMKQGTEHLHNLINVEENIENILMENVDEKKLMVNKVHIIDLINE